MRTLRQQLAGYLTFALAVAVLLATTSTVSAASATGNVGGRPANPDDSNPRTKSIFIKTIEPGRSAEDAVEVVNSTGEVKQVRVYATDSVRSSGGAFACAQAADELKSVGSWITPASTTITVPANQSVKVPFTITAPTTANVGEQNGCIVIQEQTDPTFQGGIGINFRTAIRVAVLVPGKVVKQLSAVGLKVIEKDDKIILTPIAKNTGNVSIDTTVDTTVSTIFGSKQSSNSNTFPVLRGEQAEWNIESKKPFWGGVYLASYDLNYDASNNFIDSQNKTSERKTVEGASKMFFVAPQPLALLVELLVLAGIAAALFMLVRRRRQQKLAKYSWVDYTVKKQDNIQSVAKAHGVTWKALARANGIAAPYLITEGQIIKVPSKPAD